MWQSADDRYVWRQPDFRAAVLVAAPERGIVDIQIRDEPADDSLRPVQLAIRGEPGGTSAALSERYVRNGDLIATYADSPAEVLRPQVYWRMSGARDTRLIADLEILVSLQTSRLESELTARCVTDFGPGEIWQSPGGDASLPDAFSQWNRQDSRRVERPAITLLRPREKTWSYAEMVLPHEVGRASLGPTPDSPTSDGPTPDSPTSDSPTSDSPTSDSSSWSRLETSLIMEQLEKGVIRRGRLRAVWLPREGDQQLALDVYRQFLVSRLPLTV